MKLFYEVTICVLAVLLILLMGVALEKNHDYHLELYANDQQIYELLRKLDEAEDLYSKATYHIEMMNKEREE